MWLVLGRRKTSPDAVPGWPSVVGGARRSGVGGARRRRGPAIASAWPRGRRCIDRRSSDRGGFSIAMGHLAQPSLSIHDLAMGACVVGSVVVRSAGAVDFTNLNRSKLG